MSKELDWLQQPSCSTCEFHNQRLEEKKECRECFSTYTPEIHFPKYKGPLPPYKP